jgi:hypothetical protein
MNDPRVVSRESDEMVARLQAAKRWRTGQLWSTIKIPPAEVIFVDLNPV